MDTKEFLTILSDNHRFLILGGGVLCFISLFLPFFHIIAKFSYSTITVGDVASLAATWMLWIYLIVLGGMFYAYFQNYGEKYPHLFLATGGLLVLMTLYATQIHAGGNNLISILYGFFFEFIGSLAVAIGGYYYYLEKSPHS